MLDGMRTLNVLYEAEEHTFINEPGGLCGHTFVIERADG